MKNNLLDRLGHEKTNLNYIHALIRGSFQGGFNIV